MALFRDLSPVTARWRPESGDGIEHLTLSADDERIVARSVIVGGRGGLPYGVRYKIVCDADWTVLSLDLKATDGRSLHVRSDGEGFWLNADGFPMPKLDGCIDVDLAGSPFTNTLPIRRLELEPDDGAVEFTMLYVPFDTLKPVIDRQIYTCLEPGKLYRYEAADRAFTADLAVDEDGLVVDYPGLFRRIPL